MGRHVPDGIVNLVPDVWNGFVPIFPHDSATDKPFLKLSRVNIDRDVLFLELGMLLATYIAWEMRIFTHIHGFPGVFLLKNRHVVKIPGHLSWAAPSR